MQELRRLFAVFATCMVQMTVSVCAAETVFDFRGPQRTDTPALSRAASEANSAALERRVTHIKADNVPASAVFAAIAEKAGMRVGIELTRPDEKPKLISLDIAGRTVFEAFDKLYLADQSYLLVGGGSGYWNYIPREYDTRDVREVDDKSPAHVPLPYIFTTVLNQIDFSAKSPEQALGDLLGRDEVRGKPSALPIDVVPSGLTFANAQVTFGRRDTRVRQLANILAGAAGRSWIAYVEQDAHGSKRLKVRLFDKAVDVCPAAAAVVVDLE